MNKYVFFLDLDGTLADHAFLPEENIAAIRRARESGCPVFLNTGRAPAFIPGWILDQIEFDGVIAGSGSSIRIGDRIINECTIPIDQVAKNCDFLTRTGRQCIFEGCSEVAVLSPKSQMPYPIICDSSDLLRNHSSGGFQKLNLAGKLSPAEKRYLSMFYTVIQHENYAECSLPGTNKGSALENVMELYPGYASVAIGDSANDIDMLSVADISIAMGNAPESIRHICTMETDRVEDAGVAKAIAALLNGDSSSENL